MPQSSSPNLPITSEDTAVQTPTGLEDDMVINQKAIVETIEIVFLESFPLQVHVVLKGNLPDGCMTIKETEIESDGNTFFISISTQRPVDAVCTQALVPFEESVPLDVYGLPAGVYQVISQEANAEFTFTQDNILSGGG
jgi:inhibitor of cysteine peptidase